MKSNRRVSTSSAKRSNVSELGSWAKISFFFCKAPTQSAVFCIFEYFHRDNFFKRASLLSLYEMKLEPEGIFPRSVGSKMIFLYRSDFCGETIIMSINWVTEFKTFYHNKLSSSTLTASAVNTISFFKFYFTGFMVKLNRHQLATLCFTKQNHGHFCSSSLK